MERCPNLTVLPTSSLQGPDLPHLTDRLVSKAPDEVVPTQKSNGAQSLPFEQEAVWKPHPSLLIDDREAEGQVYVATAGQRGHPSACAAAAAA